MAKKVKKPKSKLRKAIDWVITCLFAGLFVLVAIFQIMSISSKKDNYGVPSVAGYQTLVVLTDSMEPEYKVGGAVFVKKVDPSVLKEGDDVTFYYDKWTMYMPNPIVTHRVKSVTFDETQQVGYQYTITVHGINTNSENCNQTGGNHDCTYQTQTFTEKFLLGKVVGYSFFVGGVFKFISSIWGLFILLLIPALYLMVTSVIDIVKAAKMDDGDSNDTPKDSSNALGNMSDADKERLKQELLEQMISEKGKK